MRRFLALLFSVVSILIFSVLVIRDIPKQRAAATERQIPQALIFAGRVVNEETGEWPDNRLVLVFLKNKEIGRGITALGKFAESKLGVHDGLFVVTVPNTYELSLGELNRDNEWQFKLIREGKNTNAYLWIETAPEGQTYRLAVKSKNTAYVVKIVPGEVSALPEQLQVPGSASLKAGNNIVVPLGSSPAGQGVDDGSQERRQIQGVEYDGTNRTVPVNKITVPINNCGGSASIVQEYTQTQTFIHEYQAEVGGSVGVAVPLPFEFLDLQLELQAKYGFEQGQIDSRTVSYRMEAEPGTNQVYVITWQEVWETGIAQTVAGANTITVPFQVKTNLIYKVDSSKLPCN